MDLVAVALLIIIAWLAAFSSLAIGGKISCGKYNPSSNAGYAAVYTCVIVGVYVLFPSLGFLTAPVRSVFARSAPSYADQLTVAYLLLLIGFPIMVLILFKNKKATCAPTAAEQDVFLNKLRLERKEELLKRKLVKT